MNNDFSDLDPMQRLALSYARHDIRAVWALLLRFDSRLAGIVLAASEPLIAQMKLIWWRDAIVTSKASRPKGEPLLAELSRFESEQSYPGLTEALTELVDAWGLLLANEIWSEDVVRDYAMQRGQAIFGTYQRWASRSEQEVVGEGWALDDLALRSGEKLPEPALREKGLPRALSILAMAARQQRAPKRLSGIRLILHGLTGL